MDLFKLVAKLGMDSSEYERGISKAEGSFGELGSSISAKAVAMGNMIAHAMEKAVNVAANLGKSAIQNAADVTAEKAQFQATFGELQGEAEKAFAGIEKETKVFAGRLQSAGSKAFAQFKGAGLDGVEALSVMQEYTTLAADAAAYFDISLEEADEKLRSFIRGNTEAGDAIRLYTSESQRNTAALEKYGAKWKDLTEAQKQMLMLDVTKEIYDQIGVIGQAGREGESLTNILGNLEYAWELVSGTFGAPILAVIAPMIQDVSEWLNTDEVKLKIEQFGLGVADAINWVLDPEIPAWEKVKTASQATLDGINKGLETAINWALGELGMPDAETIVKDVKEWWTGQGNNAYERIKSVLKWTFGELVTPTTEGLAEKLKTWWSETFLPGLTNITQWTFGELLLPAWVDLMQGLYDWWTNDIEPFIKKLTTWHVGDVQWPSLSEMIASAKTWWSTISPSLSSIFTISVKTKTMKETIQEANESGDYSDVIDAISGPSSLPRHAGGLYYARNNYIAQLDEGEAVLTQREANAWRADQGGGTYELIAEIRELRNALMSRREVMTPDGRVIGEISYEETSRRMAGDMHSRRYAAVW